LGLIDNDAWRFSRENTPGEIYADMFVAWVYSGWVQGEEGELDPESIARRNFMDIHMYRWIQRAHFRD